MFPFLGVQRLFSLARVGLHGRLNMFKLLAQLGIVHSLNESNILGDSGQHISS